MLYIYIYIYRNKQEIVIDRNTIKNQTNCVCTKREISYEYPAKIKDNGQINGKFQINAMKLKKIWLLFRSNIYKAPVV